MINMDTWFSLNVQNFVRELSSLETRNISNLYLVFAPFFTLQEAISDMTNSKSCP